MSQIEIILYIIAGAFNYQFPINIVLTYLFRG